MQKRILLLPILLVACLAAAGTAYYLYRPNSARLIAFRTWINNPEGSSSRPAWARFTSKRSEKTL